MIRVFGGDGCHTRMLPRLPPRVGATPCAYPAVPTLTAFAPESAGAVFPQLRFALRRVGPARVACSGLRHHRHPLMRGTS